MMMISVQTKIIIIMIFAIIEQPNSTCFAQEPLLQNGPGARDKVCISLSPRRPLIVSRVKPKVNIDLLF